MMSGLALIQNRNVLDRRRARTRTYATASARPDASGAAFARTSPSPGKTVRARKRAFGSGPSTSVRSVRVQPRAGRV